MEPGSPSAHNSPWRTATGLVWHNFKEKGSFLPDDTQHNDPKRHATVRKCVGPSTGVGATRVRAKLKDNALVVLLPNTHYYINNNIEYTKSKIEIRLAI